MQMQLSKKRVKYIEIHRSNQRFEIGKLLTIIQQRQQTYLLLIKSIKV